MFAGADVYTMPLERSLGFRPDLEAIPGDVYSLARLMFLNYPNNPTGGTADLAYYERVVNLARAHSFVVAQDAAYNEMYFEHPVPSILQIPGAKDVAIEFHSLSKTFNMTGWRVGFAIGGAPMIAALGQVKANTDSGIFTAIQYAAKTALDEYATLTPPIRALYKERRDAFVGALKKLGWDVPTPEATFYVWIPCPKGYTSTQLCSRLLDEANVVTTPGLGFGRTADGYIRVALDGGDPTTARGRRSHRQALPVRPSGPRPDGNACADWPGIEPGGPQGHSRWGYRAAAADAGADCPIGEHLPRDQACRRTRRPGTVSERCRGPGDDAGTDRALAPAPGDRG